MSRIAACLLTGLLLAGPAAAPLDAQGMTQQQADEILKELRGIRLAIERLGALPAARSTPPPAPAPNPSVRLPKVTGYVMGRPDAPLTMVEFTDLQCPFCARFTTSSFGQIKTQYIDKGLVRFVSRDFPLGMHPYAELAARASRCAGEQGHYWDVREALVTNFNKLNPEFIASTAQGAKLDMKDFQSCLDSGRFKADIQRDMDEAGTIGVEGTPTFVVGRTQAAGLDGTRIVGAQPFEVFDAKFKELLAPAPAKR